MSVISFPATAQAPNCLKCSKCHVEIDAGCDCGVDYVPAAERVTAYDKANPGRSTRDAAADLGLSKSEVGRQRSSRVPSGTPDAVTGHDGKKYPAKRAAKTPISIVKPPEITPEERKAENGARFGEQQQAATPTNPLITAFQNASEKERLEFAKYVGSLKGQAKLVKAVLAADYPGRNLDPVKIGRYFELIGPKYFVESVRNAPKLWAQVEQLLAEKTLATTEFSQTTLLKASGSAGKAVH